MRIERILYGMQTANGKITLLKTAGVNNLLSFKSQETIKNLKPVDSGKYLWFKTEQTIAYPIVIDVEDKDPKHGGRTWVQNQTFLVNIHDFLNYALTGYNPFKQFVMPEQELFPDNFDSLNI